MYLLSNGRVSKRAPHEVAEQLERDTRVQTVRRQQSLQRHKRGVENKQTVEELPLNFSDPLYKRQWYIVGGAVGGYTMNVQPAWRRQYTGKGVVVVIVDDGLERAHPDIAPNYVCCHQMLHFVEKRYYFINSSHLTVLIFIMLIFC